MTIDPKVLERRAKAKAYRLANPEKHRAAFRRWAEKNKEARKAAWRKWYEANRRRVLDRNVRTRLANLPAALERERQSRKKRRQKAQEWENRQYRTNPQFRLAKLMRCALWRMAKHGWQRRSRTNEYLGCSFNELRLHLESQFKPGMSWDNHGQWEIDHIRPLASFGLTDEQQVKQAWHYSNLQPLWRRENRSKSGRHDQAA